MSDLEKIKNERERLITLYEFTIHMMELYLELVKEYHERCLEIYNDIVEIDQAIHTMNNLNQAIHTINKIKSPS